MKKVVILILIIAGLIIRAEGQSKKEEIEEQKKKTLSEIEYANRLLEETRGKKTASLNDLTIINHLLEQRRKNLLILENEADELAGSIDDNLASLKQMQERINEIRYVYSEMIVSAYKNKRKNNLIMFVLAAENSYQAYKRIRYYMLFNEFIKKQADELEMLSLELKNINEELQVKYREKDGLIEAQNIENERIKREAEEKNTLLSSLEKREKEIINEVQQKQAAAKRLDNELIALIEAEKKSSNASTILAGLTPQERIISDEFGQNRGRLPWPTERGIITGKYGEHQHPEYKAVTVRNEGIYISTLPAEDVKTIFKGKVSKVFSIPGENYTVIIKHGEYYTLYDNLVNVKVSQGQDVSTGQLIGNVYNDSESGESLLYFQIWKDIEPNNPEDWLSN